MHDDIALPDLSSCRTRPIRAKLKRRVHWLGCVCVHLHNMPMRVRFFKPPLTSFHQLVGFYPNMGPWLSFGVFPSLIILWTGISLFIGSFVQLLWQDRRITETI